MQKTVPDNTQHSQETDIHVPGGIRTRNPSKRAAAADTRLKPRGHRDRRETQRGKILIGKKKGKKLLPKLRSR